VALDVLKEALRYLRLQGPQAYRVFNAQGEAVQLLQNASLMQPASVILPSGNTFNPSPLRRARVE